MDIEKVLYWTVGTTLILIIIYLMVSGRGFT